MVYGGSQHGDADRICFTHHHHRDFICMHSSSGTCDCACNNAEQGVQDTQCAHGHQTCEADCVTNFQTVTPEEGSVDMSDDAFCSLSYSSVDILSIPLPLPDVKAKYASLYLEKLHVACQPHAMGLRAPPCIFA